MSRNLIVLGAGHISTSLCKIGEILGYDVTVCDDRAEFVTRERFKTAKNLVCDDFETFLENLEDNSKNVFVIVTRGHEKDYECLKAILKKKYSYIGMIGSRRKVSMTFERLREDGFSEEEISKVHAPIGLKIGAETPEEISISIAAELIQEKVTPSSESYEEILDNMPKDKTYVVVTIIEKQGSAPRGKGAWMIVDENGLLQGTIGGGLLEKFGIDKALEIINSKKEKIEEHIFHMDNETAKSQGMICGGTVKLKFIKYN